MRAAWRPAVVAALALAGSGLAAPRRPCESVNGVDFRPDKTHFDDAGGMQTATYLTARVPALLRLIGRG